MIGLGNVKVHSLLEVESVADLYFTVKPCSHACVKLKVNISYSFINQIKNIINEIKGSDIGIEYTDVADNKTKILFKGIIESFRFSNDLGVCVCHIEAFSKSLLLDKEKNDRLFQNKEDNIKSVIEKVSSKIETRVIYNTKIKKLGKLFLQYKETDWEFINRIASNFGEVLVSDYKSGVTAFYYGMPYSEDMVHFHPDHYESGFEIDIYEKNDLSKVHHNMPVGDRYYKISDYNDYELGSKTEFMGKIFYIKEKKIETREGYLVFTYKICDKQYIKSTPKFNENITGLVIGGKVVDVKEEHIYVKSDIDCSESVFPVVWIPITGNVMYCMPEVNSRVQLYFGDREESKIVIASDIIDHIKKSDRGLITEDKKEMSVDETSVKCGGSSMLSLSSALTNFGSIEKLNINAKGKIKIEAQMISIESNDEITVLKR